MQGPSGLPLQVIAMKRFRFCSILLLLGCISCHLQQNDAQIDTQALIGKTKSEILETTFQFSPKTDKGEIIILTWEDNGSIVSHCYSSEEEALNDSTSLLSKDKWGIDFRRALSLWGRKERFLLLRFYDGKVKYCESKVFRHF